MIPIRPNPARAERRCRQPGIRIIEIGRILHDQMDLQRQLPLSPGEGGDDSSAYAYEVRIQAASLSALEISLIVGFFALAHGERDDAPVGETDATSRLSSRQHRRRELERRSGRVSRSPVPPWRRGTLWRRWGITMANKWTKASRAKLSRTQKARWKERKRRQRRKHTRR
jgi:hypothetical protein